MTAAEVEAYVVADFNPPVDVRFAAVAVPPSAARELASGERNGSFFAKRASNHKEIDSPEVEQTHMHLE